VLDASSGAVSFWAATGVNDVLSVSLANAKYSIVDAADSIALTQAAVAAGWTGSGTNSVTGPSAGITLLNLNLADGADTIGPIAAGAANVSIVGTGTVDVSGLVKSAGTIAISGESYITEATAGGSLQGATISLVSSSGIGTPQSNLIVSSANPTVTATSGSSGVFITSTNGVNIAASASGTGNVALTNTSGTLNVITGGIDSNVTATSGNILLSSSGAIDLSGNVGSSGFSGTISIAGDTSGKLTSATDAFQQNGQSLITANTTPLAATIEVNTPTCGTGAASIGEGSIGNASGGTISVDSYGGNIVWCDTPAAQAILGTWGDADPQTGIAGAGSNSAVLAASDYVFTATGAASEIGTSARPIQAAAYGAKPLQTSANSTLGSASLAAGSGGIYFVDWSPGNAANNSMTLNSAIASGGGSIRVVAAQATGHALFVDGPVWTKSGCIQLFSDDDICLEGATIGGTHHGVPFSGTAFLAANRDASNGQTLSMESWGGVSSSIATTNSSSSAIVLTAAPSTGGYDDVDAVLPQGGIDLQNVTCGNGGTISLNAAADAVAEGIESNQQGSIVQEPGYEIDAGSDGTVSLTGRAWEDSNEYLLGGIGVAGKANSPEYLPLEIAAGKIEAVTTACGQQNSGSIDIVALTPATFSVRSSENPTSSGYYAGNDEANVILSDTSTAGPMTIASAWTGAGTENGGSVVLFGSELGGVVVSGSLGSSTTGTIAINGPLSGTGTIDLGTDKLILNQDVASRFDGVISGPHSITLEGGGTLTLTKSHNYTLGTTIDSGTTLLVNGSIASSSGETVLAGGILGGNGGTLGNVAVEGTLAPGNVGAAGSLIAGSLSFATGSAFDAYLNGTSVGSAFSQVVASGAVALNNATLNISIGSSLNLTQPEQFDILVNNSGQAISGTFSNLPEGSFGTTSTGQLFQISYLGGASGNDVVVTVYP
jgi:hypothetical protein